MKQQPSFGSEIRMPMPSNTASRMNAIDLSNTTRFENRFSLGNNPSSFMNENSSDNFPMGIGRGNRSGTGLEMSPISDNFQNLMNTYDKIAQDQRLSEDQRKSNSDYLYQSNKSSNNEQFSPNYNSFKTQTSDTINPSNFTESAPNNIQSGQSQGITPEFANQVEKSGYGPMAGLAQAPQNTPTPQMEAPKSNLYNTTNKTMEMDSKVDKNKASPPPEQYGGGGSSPQIMPSPSPPRPAGGARDRDDSLSMLTKVAHAYPHWMWGVG